MDGHPPFITRLGAHANRPWQGDCLAFCLATGGFQAQVLRGWLRVGVFGVCCVPVGC